MPNAPEHPTFTCVIPTHGRAHLLVDALASVAAQTVAPLEVLVVSDMDDPESERIVAASSVAAIARFVRSSPNGASNSRNTGAAAATGTHIAFLDDDDEWLPEHLELARDALIATGSDATASWFDVFGDGYRHEGERIVDGLTAPRVIAKNWGSTGSNLVVSRTAFDAIDGFDGELTTKNDTDFFYRLLRSGATYAAIPQVTMLQRKHSSGQLTDKSERRAVGNERYLRKHRAALTLRDRRDLRLAIHRIRRSTSGTRGQRLVHTALALFNYSPRKFAEERALRRRTAEVTPV